MLTYINLWNAKRYCIDPVEKIDGYERAKNEPGQFHLHHRLEEQGYSRKELISKGLYYERPAEELVFLTREEHVRLHHEGKTLSGESRKNLSEKRKGEKNPMYGKPAYNKINICPAILQMMRYEQHMTYKQIGEHFGVHWSTIQKKLLLLNK